MFHSIEISAFMLFLLFSLVGCASVLAQGVTEYKIPPDDIVQIVDAEPTPSPHLDPKRAWLLLRERPNLGPISELAQPELRLAGHRINPATNGPSRSRYYIRLTLKSLADGSEQLITGITENARIQHTAWSPDGQKIAFSVTGDNGIALWVADVASATAKPLTDPVLNAAFSGSPFRWVSDTNTLLCRFIPEDRGDPPVKSLVPTGPIIQENMGKKGAAATYQDLLENSHDETLFDYYFTSQLATVTVDGTINRIGDPGIFVNAEPSPSGEYILAEQLHRPYSYIVRSSRFPLKIDVWDMSGAIVHEVVDLPLAEDIPMRNGSARKGQRGHSWRADTPATLYWTEAQDEGDADIEADIRDIVYTLAAPFSAEPTAIISLGLRYGGVTWSDNGLALVRDWWWKTRLS